MGATPLWGRYAELRPEELDQIRAAIPVAYLPWGNLAWHGPHLPLGIEGIMAEAMAERCVKRSGGVLLPTTSWPSGGRPHQAPAPHSEALRATLDEILAGLGQAGWRVAVLISGNHGPAHDLMMMAAAQEAITRYGLLTIAVPPLALVDEEMLDYGGLWESSVLLALRPDLVALEALDEWPLGSSSGVIGRDPRHTASPSLGLSALNLAIERLSIAVADLLEKGDPAPLHALYERRREHYSSFAAQALRRDLAEG